MKGNYFILALSAFGLTGCVSGMINESTAAIHCNRMAVEESTQAIEENTQLIQESSRQLETISQGLGA